MKVEIVLFATHKTANKRGFVFVFVVFFLAVLGLCCFAGVRSHSLVAVHRFLFVFTSLV